MYQGVFLITCQEKKARVGPLELHEKQDHLPGRRHVGGPTTGRCRERR